jgi:hypothetical protein
MLAVLAATLGLQSCSVRVHGKGSIGVSAVGVIVAAAVLGTGPAMAVAAVAAVFQFIRSHGVLHRAVFDAANFALAAGAAGLVDSALEGAAPSDGRRFVAAALGGFAYVFVNSGLLLVAMSLSESKAPLAIWRQRFHWARFHLLALAPTAAVVALLEARIGAWALLTLAVLALPLVLSLRHRLHRLPGVAAPW